MTQKSLFLAISILNFKFLALPLHSVSTSYIGRKVK